MKKLNLILLLLSCLPVFGQKIRLRKAQDAFDHKEYLITIKLLNKVRFSDLTEYQKLLRAESYRETHSYREALHAFENLDFEVLNLDSAYLHFAQVLETNGSYEKAQKYYEIYLSRNPEHVFSKLHISKDLNLLNTAGLRAKISPLNTNTDENDFVAFMFQDQLVFSSGGYSNGIRKSKWDGEHFLDYYHKPQQEVTLFSSVLNSRLHEGPGFYDTLRQKLFFTSNATIHEESSGNAHSNLKIYESSWEDGNWTKPVELSFNDEQYSRGHPTSLSGKDFIIFSSNESGEVDLFIVYKENGRWGVPQSLGNQINTEGKELFPYLADENTLYFSSDGHGGYGGLDLFVCKINQGVISEITNLGKAFNSSKDDFGLMFKDNKGLSGYYCSDKNGGLGSADIYQFELQNSKRVMKFVDPWGKQIVNEDGLIQWKGMSKNVQTNSYGESPINIDQKLYVKFDFDKYHPKIEELDFRSLDTLEVVLFPKDYFRSVSGHLKNDQDNEPVKNAQVKVEVDTKSYEGKTNENGDFDLLLPKRKEYVFEFKKDGFLSNQVVIPDDGKEHSSKIQKVEKGTILKLENIYYEFDKDFITQRAKPILGNLVKIMTLNPELEIEVSSHSDSRGADDYNKDLSLRRAKSVVDYLEKRGIGTERLSIKYYGEKKLVNDCGDDNDCLEKVHSKNRRTEFKVVQF